MTLEAQEHLPGHAAITEVASRGGAELGDVLGLGKIHFEERPDSGGQRQQVKGGLGGFRGFTSRDQGAGGLGGFNGRLEVGEDTGFCEQIYVGAQVAVGWRFVAVQSSESLHNLCHAAVAMHVSKPADVHKDVEAERGPGVEGSEGFVVAAAVAQTQLNDL